MCIPFVPLYNLHKPVCEVAAISITKTKNVRYETRPATERGAGGIQKTQATY